MEYQVCNLSSIDDFIVKRVTKTPNCSISALLRDCRKRVPLIGDYVILLHIIRILKEQNYQFTYSKVNLVLQNTEEYKEATFREKNNIFRSLVKQCNLEVEQ